MTDEIDQKIEALILAIKHSDEYRQYMKLKDLASHNEDINQLTRDISKYQKEMIDVKIHQKKDITQLKQKLDILNQELNLIPLYTEYKYSVDELNNILTTCIALIESYIKTKLD